MRGEAARRGTEAGAGSERAAGRRQHAREVTPVNPLEAPGHEERRSRVVRLQLGPDPLQPVEHGVPQRAHALGVRRHEPQRRAARHRLPQPHPAHHAKGLGRSGHLPHHLLAPRLGRQRGRLREQSAAVAERREELEAGVEDANDHDRTHVRIRVGGVQGGLRGGAARRRYFVGEQALPTLARWPRSTVTWLSPSRGRSRRGRSGSSSPWSRSRSSGSAS